MRPGPDPWSFTVGRFSPSRSSSIVKLAFDVIPQDPTRPEYPQGATLGADLKHWLQGKFFQQYRLFFRNHATSQLIVFAWVNDETSKCAYGSSDDTYRVFRKMLEGGLARTKSPHLLVDHGDELDIVRRRLMSSMGIPSFLAQLVMSPQSTGWLRHTSTA